MSAEAVVAIIVGGIAAWSAVLLWAVKAIVATVTKHLGDQIEALKVADVELAKDLKDVSSNVVRLQGSLLTEYVGREDWIRFSNQIDHKIDRFSIALRKLLKERPHAQRT